MATPRWTPALAVLLAACGADPAPADTAAPVDQDRDGVAQADDCDDTDPRRFPGNVEACDGIDNDCDDEVDEEVALSWYTDRDGDGFGDPDTLERACLPPTDQSTQLGTDCDDTNAAVHPAGREVCDLFDNNCDGLVDNDDSLPVVESWLDADADGFGDPEAPLEACLVPDDHVTNAQDCDDDDASVFPGASEEGPDGGADGIDNDCDGDIDDNLPNGSGADGAYTLGDATFADLGGACTPVDSIVGAQLTVDDAGAFQPGDRALLVTLQANDADTSTVGVHQFADVKDADGVTVELVDPVSRAFAPVNADLRDHAVALFRVPQLTDLTLTGDLLVPAFDGACGGVAALVATGTIDIQGSLSLVGAGYPGGETATGQNTSGRAGEGRNGRGSRGYERNDNGGGGGGSDSTICSDCEGNGGGGGHATPGELGTTTDPARGLGGDGGVGVGSADLQHLLFGGGGGAGARDANAEGGLGGAGGAGGGALILRAQTLRVSGLLDVSGQAGDRGCASAYNPCETGAASEAGAGGGGAGGALWLQAQDLELSPNSLLALGGPGAESAVQPGLYAGDGGLGRVRLDFETLNGHARGSTQADEAAALSASPAPGYVGAW